MTGSLESGRRPLKLGTVICPIAEAQALLNKLKREEYVGPHRSGSVPPSLMVREFRPILVPSWLLAEDLT